MRKIGYVDAEPLGILIELRVIYFNDMYYCKYFQTNVETNLYQNEISVSYMS